MILNLIQERILGWYAKTRFFTKNNIFEFSFLKSLRDVYNKAKFTCTKVGTDLLLFLYCSYLYSVSTLVLWLVETKEEGLAASKSPH
jgi:hypothetical protein